MEVTDVGLFKTNSSTVVRLKTSLSSNKSCSNSLACCDFHLNFIVLQLLRQINARKQSQTPTCLLSDHWKIASSTAQVPAETVDDVVPIVICSSEERMGATMATINSVYSNTDARVFFYIVTLRDAVKLTRFVICFLLKH